MGRLAYPSMLRGQAGGGAPAEALARPTWPAPSALLPPSRIKHLTPPGLPASLPSVRLLASLEHPNLLRFHEAFVDHHTLCIVTELALGGDLGQFIE